MKTTHEVFCVNQLNLSELQALELAEKILGEFCENYAENCCLVSVNDGECVLMEELPRVRGILDFFMRNRVVSVDIA